MHTIQYFRMREMLRKIKTGKGAQKWMLASGGISILDTTASDGFTEIMFEQSLKESEVRRGLLHVSRN